MSKLYEIANDYAALLNDDLDPELIADTIEGMEGEFTDKVGSLLAMCKNESAYAGNLKAEAIKLQARAKAIESRVENVKLYMISCMETIDKKSITAGLHRLTIRSPSMLVKITDETQVPSEYCEFETTIKIDKTKLKATLKSGEKVQGAELKAGKPSLIIK